MKAIQAILKTVVIILVVLWMGLFIYDYFNAKNAVKPIICLSEKNIQKDDATYYTCTSFGYKYSEYTDSNKKVFGINAFFLTSQADKEIGE